MEMGKIHLVFKNRAVCARPRVLEEALCALSGRRWHLNAASDELWGCDGDRRVETGRVNDRLIEAGRDESVANQLTCTSEHQYFGVMQLRRYPFSYTNNNLLPFLNPQ